MPGCALVVDDDPDQLFIVASVLSRLGLTVVTASGGEALLDKLATLGPFDLIVTDISMPAMTGVQAMERARSMGHRSPVIVTTAMRDAHLLDQVAALGGVATLLYKPFTIATLAATVRGLIGSTVLAGARDAVAVEPIEQRVTRNAQ